MNRREFLVSSVAAGALALGAPTAFAQDKLTILGSVPSLSFPFFVHMLNQIKVEAEAQGVNLIESDGQNSAPKQTADIEAAIVQKVNAIVISPLDVNALAPATEPSQRHLNAQGKVGSATRPGFAGVSGGQNPPRIFHMHFFTLQDLSTAGTLAKVMISPDLQKRLSET